MTLSLLSKISVEELYGEYTYELPRGRELPPTAVLYGDNGVGKSTILQAVFHLLSPSNSSGHRSALARIPFRKLTVEMFNGLTISAERENPAATAEPLTLTVVERGSILAHWIYAPKSEEKSADDYVGAIAKLVGEWRTDGRVDLIDALPDEVRKRAETISSSTYPTGSRAFTNALRDRVPRMFLLTADRRLESDEVPRGTDAEMRRALLEVKAREMVGRARDHALEAALNGAAKWITSKAVEGQNLGIANVHTVYEKIVRDLLHPARTETFSPIAELNDRLDTLEELTNELTRFGLASTLNMNQFRAALKKRDPDPVIARVVQNYLESAETRFDALEPIFRIVETFVDTVNFFFTDKQISFSTASAFTIEKSSGTNLEPHQLSSGEQQLLLLFSYILTARDNQSVFIIDEPEISLNVKWQRQLMRSLEDLSGGAKIQFILASHSIELISRRRSDVVVVGRES